MESGGQAPTGRLAPMVPGEQWEEARACRCRSKYCPKCKGVEALKLSKQLQAAINHWGDDTILYATLTVDGSTFPDRERMYEHLQDSRAVGETIKALRREGLISECFTGVEYQKNGSVHYHLLARCPAGAPSQDRLYHFWNLHRPAWAGPVERFGPEHKMAGELRPAVGWVKCEVLRKRDAGAYYVTKYAAKEDGIPDWLIRRLDRGKRPKRFSTTRGFWDRVRPPRPRRPSTRPRRESRPPRPFAERVARCHASTSVFRVTAVLCLGHTKRRYEYCGAVQSTVEELANDLGAHVEGSKTGFRLRPGEARLLLSRAGPKAYDSG